MSVLHPTRVSTKRFAWDQNRGEFLADISDLGRDFRFGRVYDDACDEGLTLVREKTGHEIVCAVEHEERRDGETLYWRLTPANRKDRGKFSVVLFND